MVISKDIQYIGVNDRAIDLFEGQYAVPNGMSYNSYLITDEKIAVMDTVDGKFTEEWLNNLNVALNGRTPDYLLVQHMEPDHSANVAAFAAAYPTAKIVASAKAFVMMKNFFGTDFRERQLVVGEGDTLVLGRHVLSFLTAPMVHWPEVIMTYDSADKILFSADAFGKFGTPDTAEPWSDEARRYYIGIVGKYGVQVQGVLKKAAELEISAICPLHGPVLQGDLGEYLRYYQAWSSYTPEEPGVVVAYTSVYGHTKTAALALAEKLQSNGCVVKTYDLARCDMSAAVADAFRYDRLVLATTTYNGDIFPFMRTFIEHLTERNFRNRTVAFIENGSWAPVAARVMRGLLETCKQLTYAENSVKILSAMTAGNEAQIASLAKELCEQTAAHSETATAAEPSTTCYVCKICGYVYEGETLPDGFVCPLCKHDAEYFEKKKQ